MKSAARLVRKVLVSSLLLTVAFAPRLLLAQTTQPGKAEVRSIKGSATYSLAGGAFVPLKVGNVLSTGAAIKTGKESTVDLFLGNSAGVVRVSENSTLSLDKLALTDTGADTVVDVQLNLPDGMMLFNVNKISAASRYEIKVPNGVAGIRGTRGRCMASGAILLLDGSLIFVHVPPGGNPIPFTLTAPPAVFFDPKDGSVKPAPNDMIQEARKEMGKLAGPPPPGSASAQTPPKTQEQPHELPVSPNTGNPQ